MQFRLWSFKSFTNNIIFLTEENVHCKNSCWKSVQNTFELVECTAQWWNSPVFHSVDCSLLRRVETYRDMGICFDHGLRTPNEGIYQRNLKNWADVAVKICFGCT